MSSKSLAVPGVVGRWPSWTEQGRHHHVHQPGLQTWCHGIPPGRFDQLHLCMSVNVILQGRLEDSFKHVPNRAGSLWYCSSTGSLAVCNCGTVVLRRG